MTNTNNIKILGVIPARIGSTRIPEKMLKDICGKPLIQRTYERSKEAGTLNELVIVTDSDEIESVARGFGAKVLRSVREHNNGTERTAEALELFTDFSPDIVVTIWGDEPLYPATAIDACVEMLRNDDSLFAVTAADRIVDERMINENSVVKIVTDIHNHALYISRATIPYNFRDNQVDYYHVIGAMAMRPQALSKYVTFAQTPLEIIEGVEQLRILENGFKLGIVKGDFENLGVNTPDEFEKVVEIYKKRISEGLV